jgi:hypothetical protein
MSEETILFCLATFGAIAPPIVDWLVPEKVKCRRVVHMGGPAPPEGTVSYFYERADVVGD